jgi:anti-sigma factor RsiW
MSQVSDEELNALVDGRLEEPRLSEVLRAIDADPNLSLRAQRYRDQLQGLHALYDGVLREPVPSHLLRLVQDSAPSSPITEIKARRLPASWRAAAALLGVFVVGLAGGWLGHGQLQGERGLLQSAVKQAVLAHQMLELAVADQQDALPAGADTFTVGADANPFEVPLRVPNTAGDSNFVPVAFQSATGAAGPTVQLAYRNAEGKEVTLFVQPHSASRKVPYQASTEDGFDVLFWIDGPLVYVLVGKSGREQLLGLADSFYSAAGLRPASTEAAKP